MSTLDHQKYSWSFLPLAIGVSLLVTSVIFTPERALAIPPPDFVVNAGMQIAQVLGVVAFFCSTGIAFLYRKFRSSINTPRRKLAVLGLIVSGFWISWYLIQSS